MEIFFRIDVKAVDSDKELAKEISSRIIEIISINPTTACIKLESGHNVDRKFRDIKSIFEVDDDFFLSFVEKRHLDCSSARGVDSSSSGYEYCSRCRL